MLDAKYAQTVEATLAALAAAPATARARVRYVGALPRAQLHEAMRLAAMVLNTSESEGQCNSLLEAMLAGTLVTWPSWRVPIQAGRQLPIRIQYTSHLRPYSRIPSRSGDSSNPGLAIERRIESRISFNCFDP